MRWALRSIKVMAALIGLLAAAYALLPWWLPAVIASLLPGQVELIELVVERPKSDRMRVSALKLVFPQADQDVIEFSLEDVELSYHWRQLKAWQVNSVTIQHLQLSLPAHYASAEVTTSDAATQQLSNFLPSTLISKLPMSSFKVERITVQRPGYPQFGAWRGSAELSQSNLKFVLDSGSELNAGNEAYSGWFLEGLANKRNELSLTILNSGSEVANIHSKISVANSRVTELVGSSLIHAGEVSRLLHHLTLLDPMFSVAGTLESEWTMTLPAELEALANTELMLNGVARGELQARALDLGQLHCGVAESDTKQILGAFNWAGDQITFSEFGLKCDGYLAEGSMPKLLSELGVQGKLPYNAHFRQASRLSFTLPTRRLELEEGALELSLSAGERGGKNVIVEGRAIVDKGYHHFESRDAPSSTQLEMSTSLALSRFKWAPYSVRTLALSASNQLSLTNLNDQMSAIITVAPGASVQAERVRWLNGGTSKLLLKTQKEVTLEALEDSFLIGKATLVVTGSPIHAFGPRLEYDALRLTSSGIRVIPPPSTGGETAAGKDKGAMQFVGDMQLRGDSMLASFKSLQSHPLALEMNMTTQGSALRGKLLIAPEAAGNNLSVGGENFSLSATFNHDIESNQGQANIQTPRMHFNENNKFLPRLVQHWSYPIDFSAGMLSIESLLSWRRGDATSDSRVDFVDLGGFYERNLFHGLNGSLRARYSKKLLEINTQQLTLDKIEAGLTLENLVLSLRPALPNTDKERRPQSGIRPHVAGIEADVLGGTLRVNDLFLDPQEAEHSFDVHLESLKLEQLLKLESGVTGSGILDAQLPVVVSKEGISMDNGQVIGRAPGGVIRYEGELPKAALDSNPQLGLALNALKNFHYAVLNMKTTYTQSGKLTLQTRLEGKNPDLTNGRPIHFNLNITEDIPALLKSLQLSQDISDKLDARIQQLSR